jgi:hypothetical protein
LFFFISAAIAAIADYQLSTTTAYLILFRFDINDNHSDYTKLINNQQLFEAWIYKLLSKDPNMLLGSIQYPPIYNNLLILRLVFVVLTASIGTFGTK